MRSRTEICLTICYLHCKGRDFYFLAGNMPRREIVEEKYRFKFSFFWFCKAWYCYEIFSVFSLHAYS